jgi:hypothetical protein
LPAVIYSVLISQFFEPSPGVIRNQFFASASVANPGTSISGGSGNLTTTNHPDLTFMRRRCQQWPAPSTGQDQAAKSFFEDLLRRGRLKIARTGKSAAEVVRSSAPLTHETYTHELRREGRQMVLRRVRIDCGFAHR